MNQKIYLWIEDYLFYPNTTQKILSFILLPLTFIYLLIILLKRTFTKKQSFGIPVISIGNLIVGGSGKTPMAIKLASKYEDVCIVLRGYGRQSQGLFVVSNKGEILEDIKTSGDEAILLAKSLKNASVIVSEDRIEAIKKAKELGCKLVFLDDGFSKYKIEKFDILLRPKNEPTNDFCLPSGGYREPKGFYAQGNLVLKEGKDFFRKTAVKFEGKDLVFGEKVVLLTAISKPKRVLEFLPKNTELLAFADHHTFLDEEINEIKEKYKDYQILTTGKDLVKLDEFKIKNLYLISLDIEFSKDVNFSLMDKYINEHK